MKPSIAIKIFLRISLSFSFLSAVADRLGLWPKSISVWGNWQNFVEYTQILNPWVPSNFINIIALIATVAEVIFAFALIIGYKTELFARLSGILLLLFALAMCFNVGLKSALDYSVFTSAAAAFALSIMSYKHWEIDVFIHNNSNK